MFFFKWNFAMFSRGASSAYPASIFFGMFDEKDFGVFHFSHDSIVEHIRSQKMTSRFHAFTSLTSQIRRHTFAQTFFR